MRLRTQRLRPGIAAVIGGLAVSAGGCGYGLRGGGPGSPSVRLVRSVESVLADYHREVERSADADERRAIAGFVAMRCKDGIDERASRAHAAGFEAWMARIQTYRRGEQVRYSTAQRNVDDLRASVAQLQQHRGDLGRIGAVLSRVAGIGVTGGGLEAVGGLSEVVTQELDGTKTARSGE